METTKSDDKTSLAGGNQQSSLDTVFKALNILTFLLVIVSVIVGSLTLKDIGNCDDDNSCPTTFETLSSTSAVAPLCDATCAQVNYNDLLGPKYYLYYYLMGPMRLVKSDITGDETIYSDNMGAVNDLQPLLCNYTASTGNTTATVFQYDSTTEEFTRVITTVPKASGGYAICTTLNKTSASYAALIQGEAYYGSATLFGVDYDTIYAPIFDYNTGDIIGCLYIGSPV